VALVHGPTLSFRNVSRFCDAVYECRADNGASSGAASHRVRLTVECKIISASRDVLQDSTFEAKAAKICPRCVLEFTEL